MTGRLIGLETEFCIRHSSPAGSRQPLTNRQICEAILQGIGSVVATLPGEGTGWPCIRSFAQNGGAFSYEASLRGLDHGLLESATPECRGAAQVLLYQRAQEAIILRAVARAAPWLTHHGRAGDIAVVKNCLDAEGHVYGAQENYEAEIARGWRLVAYRVGLTLLLPVVFLALVLFWAVMLIMLLTLLLILLVFPLARHWVGLDSYSASPGDSAGGVGAESNIMLLRALTAIYLILLGPAALVYLGLVRLTAFRGIRAGATAFLVSRVVVTGSGTLNSDGTYALSERAQSVVRTVRAGLGQRGRAIFETTNLAKPMLALVGRLLPGLMGLFRRRQRLQLGVSDSNCAQTAEYLKFGITSLVFDMAEAGFLDDAPRLKRPVKALRIIAGDPTLRARVRLEGGAEMSGVAIQRWYARRAEEFLARQQVNTMESRDILALWQSTLDALERSRGALVGKLDWVTKLALLDGAGPVGQAARKKIDIKYHELGGGYLSLLERRGLAPVLTSEHQIALAMKQPPDDTPAFMRGQFILTTPKGGGGHVASWSGAGR
jgi:Pup amidohydrolase